MKLTAIKHTLELKHQFSISYSSRKTTPIVIVRIEDEEFTGFGEASLPPYVKENQDSVINFLNNVSIKPIKTLSDLIDFTNELELRHSGNYSAKAALNIALNDILGQKLKLPCWKIYGINNKNVGKSTSFTIGIDNEETIRKKILEAEEFNILKIKLGTERDKQIVSFIREFSDKPLYADANQGWDDKYYALDMINWLNEKNVVLIEQPMPVNMLTDCAWLKEQSTLPIIADEAVQNYADIDKIKYAYHGINIKLMKCGGMNEARRMIEYAKKLDLKVMLGCMTETSCAVSAAVQFSTLADYIDLDGNLLITNDPFSSEFYKNGKIYIPDEPGLGIKLRDNLFAK